MENHNDNNTQNKYNAPSGPPPTYGTQIPNPQQHHDAGPYPQPNNNQYQNQYNDPRAPEQAYSGYGSPPPQQQQGGYYYNNQPGFNGPPPQGFYGPPQQGYYGPPQQQGMYYQQQQPMYGPPAGHYGNRSGAGEGICAGLLGLLACCCCLDFLF